MVNIIAFGISITMLSVIGVILNGICICILRKSKSLKARGSSLLILNLLFLHFGQSMVVLPIWLLDKLEISNSVVAKNVGTAWLFTYILSFYGTTLSVFFISLDRFLATYLLNRYKILVTIKRIKIAILSLWMYVVALSCIPFIPEIKRGISHNSNETLYKPQKLFYIPQKPWVVFMLSFNAALPYILILMCYIYIASKLNKMKLLTVKNDINDSSSINSITRINSNKNVIRKGFQRDKYVTQLSLALAIAYGIFWSPSVFYYITVNTCSSCFPKDWDSSNVRQHVKFIAKFCAFMDTIAAPLIYCFSQTGFRIQLRRFKSIVTHREYSSNTVEDTKKVSWCCLYLEWSTLHKVVLLVFFSEFAQPFFSFLTKLLIWNRESGLTKLDLTELDWGAYLYSAIELLLHVTNQCLPASWDHIWSCQKCRKMGLKCSI